MSARKFRHVGHASEVAQARNGGSLVSVLCGRTVHPLPPEALDPLPTCPTCAQARDLAFAEGRAHYYFRAEGFAWVEVNVGGAA